MLNTLHSPDPEIAGLACLPYCSKVTQGRGYSPCGLTLFCTLGPKDRMAERTTTVWEVSWALNKTQDWECPAVFTTNILHQCLEGGQSPKPPAPALSCSQTLGLCNLITSTPAGHIAFLFLSAGKPICSRPGLLATGPWRRTGDIHAWKCFSVPQQNPLPDPVVISWGEKDNPFRRTRNTLCVQMTLSF